MSRFCCRICLSENDCTRNIFTDKCSNGQSYAEALMSYADGITVVENDAMPSHLCESCISELESSVVNGTIDADFVSKYVSSERPATNANIKTEPKSEDRPQARRSEKNIDAAAEIEEIHLKTEPDDEYFRIDIDKNGTYRLEKKPFECDPHEKYSDGDVCEKLCSASYSPASFVGEPEDVFFDRVSTSTISKTELDSDDFPPDGRTGTSTDAIDEHANVRAEDIPSRDNIEGGSDDFSRERTASVETNVVPEEIYLIMEPVDEYRMSTFKCDFCEKSFARRNNLKAHRRVHTGEKPYECDRCDKVFRYKSTLTQHLLTHTGEKPYECDLCGKSFTQSSALKTHRRIHTREKPYECDRCKKAFSQKATLTHHLRMHADEKPFECDPCGKSFTTKHYLKAHRCHVRAGEEPYKCDRCDKVFGYKTSLTQHLRRHTGEKPYACDVCGKTFAQNSTLKTHRRVHTKEKPYECDRCGRTFGQKASLTHHLRTDACRNRAESPSLRSST